MKKNILLIYYTVRHLKLKQVWHQVMHRIFRRNKTALIAKCKKKFPLKVSMHYTIKIDGLDDSINFLNRYDAVDLEQGKIQILHESHQINWNTWKVDTASHLWNYNLHYLEFLIPLAVKYKQTQEEKYYTKWKQVWKSWNKANGDDSYEPYTISLRIPNILVCMEFLHKRLREDLELETEIYNEIYHEYKYLLCNQELWLLGNHYFENLKTIVICSLLFGEEKVWNRYYKKLCGQIKEQILEDGVHYERSLMYHKIIMEDVMRLIVFMQGFEKEKESRFLIGTLQTMLDAISSLENGMGRTPLFNDAGDNVAKSLSDLLLVCRNTFKLEPVIRRCFETAGYYRLDNSNKTLLFDCGQYGPDYMLGHAHCDALSFELSVDGVPLFVNAGTGQYQGKHRIFFRSTEAHNTVILEGKQQAELWGEHRVARRGKCIQCDASETMLEGSICSYEGDYYKRRIEWLGKDVLIVHDEVAPNSKCGNAEKVKVFYRIAPQFHYKEVKGIGFKKFDILSSQDEKVAHIELSEGLECMIHRNDSLCLYAEQFGKYESCEVLEIGNIKENDVQITIKIIFAKKGEKYEK